jgi:transposase-like protein
MENLIYSFCIIVLVLDMIENPEKIKLERLRKMRAYAIIAKGDMPQRKDRDIFVVPSQSNPQKTYTVTHNGGWHCTCPDHMETGLMCKHIQSVQMWEKFDEGEDDDVLSLNIDIEHPQCPTCGSYAIVKNGKRKTEMGTRQRYICKDCKHRFTLEPIKYRKATTKLIALCLDLYYKGLSLRKISDTVEQFYNLSIHHDTIRVWIDTFMEQIKEYVSEYKPNLGETWNIDEQKIKSEGKWLYSWNILDKKTRFLIANEITEQRSILETQMVLRKAKQTTKREQPKTIVSDGMKAYPAAIQREFDGVIHIGGVGIRDAINNNTLERYHGTYRERNKVMRGLQNGQTARQMNDNMRVYYNFIREHTALDGMTPAENAGINLTHGKNRWIELLTQSL